MVSRGSSSACLPAVSCEDLHVLTISCTNLGPEVWGGVGRKGWQRVSERLAKGWPRVGEGLAKGWQVSLHPQTLQFPRRLFRRPGL